MVVEAVFRVAETFSGGEGVFFEGHRQADIFSGLMFFEGIKILPS